MDLQKIVDAAGPVILAFGLKIIGALAAWIAGPVSYTHLTLPTICSV